MQVHGIQTPLPSWLSVVPGIFGGTWRCWVSLVGAESASSMLAAEGLALKKAWAEEAVDIEEVPERRSLLAYRSDLVA